MSLQEFKASLPASNECSGGKTEEQIKNSDTKGSNLRPPSGKAKSSQDKLSTKPTDGGKLLRDKQIEERKKKNEQRKAAVEDRRKQKELEDSVKNTALRQLLEHKGGPPGAKTTGRKLPNVPGNTSYPRRETSATRRLSSSSSSSDSTGHTPPGSGKHTRNTRRNLTGPSSASTSSLNSFGSNLGKPQTNLGASKKTSVSTNNLNDKTLGAAKTGQRVKEKGAGVQSRRSAGSVLPKAQSMGAIHQVGTKTSSSRPQSGKKPKPKQVHHAGTASEAEAKQALAERRKRIREEAERKALLDKEKQEELRRQREEEEKRLAEENAKEMARQAELAKQLQEQEKERAKLLQEQREKDAEIEAEKLVAEAKRKEELEVLRKQEMERRAKEAEKREKEEEERLKREEIERQERRKRVEMIMSRTRLTSTVNTNMNNAESYSSLEDLSVKLSDEHHSSTVSDILQKVKEKSRATSPISPEQQKENQQFLENAGKESLDGKNENSNDVLRPIDNSKHGGDGSHQSLDTRVCNEDTNGTLRVVSGYLMHNGGTSWDNHGTSSETERTLIDNHSTSRDIDGTSGRINCASKDNHGTFMDNGGTLRDTYNTSRDTDGTLRSIDCTSRNTDGSLHDNKSSPRVNGGNTRGTIEDVNNGHKGTAQDTELWKNVEHFMISTENDVRENLERIGIFAQDEEDEDGEEGQLWKVVEGKREITEVV